MIRQLEQCGASYYLNGKKEDLFQILAECGANLIRLRLWQDPYDEDGNPYGGGMNDLSTTVELARRAVTNGMDILLDFHYSDFWTDPSKQIKPKAWTALEGKSLETAVRLYTVNVLKTLKNQGIVPKLIQVGNEITHGLLWPEGHVENTERMTALLKAGIDGVRQICPNSGVILHLDFGTDNALYRKWFDAVTPYDLDFDIIGMSYYPHWNGSLEQLTGNMQDVSTRYQKDVFIAETSIGYTADPLDCKGIVFTNREAEATGYPATPEGQESFLRDLTKAIRSVKDGRGIGFSYWEPAWLPIQECTWATKTGCDYVNDKCEPGNTMANQALFDRKGNANPALLNLASM